MKFFNYIHEPLLNLLSAKLRSFLAILGVLVGTASVVALISSSKLATTHALAEFKSLGTNLILINIHDDQSTNTADQLNVFQLSDVPELIHASSKIELVAPYTMSFHPMYFAANNLDGHIIGATDNFLNIAKLTLQRGRFISTLDRANFFCVIGAAIAKKIEKTGENPLDNQIRVGDNLFTIVGILKPWRQNVFLYVDIDHSIIVPIKTSYFLDKNIKINNILVRLTPNSNITVIQKKILTVLKTILPNKEIAFNNPKEIVRIIAKQRETYTELLIAIGCISLLVGGIGVMNIMLVSVIERRREIGIRMALGARQIDILRLFLVESIVLTIFGGSWGVVCGVLISYFLAFFSHWEFYFYVTPVVLGFVVSVVVGILSGFYPAWRASKLNPVETLHAS